MKLTMVQKSTNRRRSKQTPRCPECGSTTTVPIIHGIPTAAEREALRKGDAILADREEWEGMTQWYCKACGCDWSGDWRRFKRPFKS